MVMSTRAMNMTVFQFFGGGIPDLGDFNIEGQRDAGHGVVSVKNQECRRRRW